MQIGWAVAVAAVMLAGRSSSFSRTGEKIAEGLAKIWIVVAATRPIHGGGS